MDEGNFIGGCSDACFSVVELVTVSGRPPRPRPHNRTVPRTPRRVDFLAPTELSVGLRRQSVPAPDIPTHGGYAPNSPPNAERCCRVLVGGAACAPPAGRRTSPSIPFRWR